MNHNKLSYWWIMILASIIPKIFIELRIISSPTQVLTLLSKMTATSWPLAIFYRLSFIARRGKQSCFSPAEFNRWGKSHNSTKCKWSLTPKVQCLLSTADAVPPISFLKFLLLFHITVHFLLDLCLWLCNLL